MTNGMYKKDMCAFNPPMGWNSWDCYAASVNEGQLLGNAEYMKDNLLRFGWEYVVCDIQWSEPLAGTEDMEYRPFAALALDGYSRLIPAENRFPSAAGEKGFAPIAEKIHGMGLKFGIHIMRGIPRQAVHGRMKIKGTDWTADQIADPFSICKWNGDMYGLNPRHPGAQDYYNSIFELYAQWKVDYVKVDDIANTSAFPHNPYSAREEVEMIRRAIDKCGRPMVLSLSPGPAVITEAWHLKKHANLWRMTDDFWDRWDLLKDMFRRCEIWQEHVGPGCWPDCDMLPLGRIGISFGKDRYTNFTRDEQQTMMTLWCLFRSPLMMGGEMRDNDPWTLSLLTNEEVLKVHKCVNRACQIERTNDYAIWYNRETNGDVYLGLFNLSDDPGFVGCSLNEVGMTSARAFDLWNKKEAEYFSDRIDVRLKPHASCLLRLTQK